MNGPVASAPISLVPKVAKRRRTPTSVENILTDLRKDLAATEMRWSTLIEAIATFEQLKNGGRKPRGRPRGSGRKPDPVQIQATIGQTT